MEERDSDRIPYSSWEGPWSDDDPDANFKADVAAYSKQDPLATLTAMSRNLDVPVGALVRYVLAKWASGGAEGVLELGPSTVERMRVAVEDAEAAGTDEARLAAYEQLAAMVGWLGAGLDDPATAYPAGGAGAPRQIRPGVYGLAVADGAVLLAHSSPLDRRPGTWTLPGGGLDHGETVEEALRREFHEETGLTPVCGELLGVRTERYEPQPGRGMPEDVHAVHIVLHVEAPTEPAPQVTEVDGSVDDVRWVPVGELAQLDLGTLATWAVDRAGLA